MLTYLIVIIANLLIGGMIGLTGIAGFLLPMLYSGFMGMPAVQALALSFFAFLISGILGSWNYYKAKNRQIPLPVCILFGLITAAVCALSGAGGPILVMPLLVVMGVPVKTAVGVALFDSIFIAIPSCIGYTMQCDILSIGGLLAVSMISHGIGVWFGSHNTSFLKPELLKKGVAVFSILIAVVKLITG